MSKPTKPTKIPFTTAAFVAAVKKKRILWDHTMKSSFKRETKKAAWNDVAAQFLEEDVNGT